MSVKNGKNQIKSFLIMVFFPRFLIWTFDLPIFNLHYDVAFFHLAKPCLHILILQTFVHV